MGLIERARAAGFDAAQVKLNAQGGHLAPEDRPLFDAAVDAALQAANYQGAVEVLEQIADPLGWPPSLRDKEYVVAMRKLAADAIPGRGQ